MFLHVSGHVPRERTVPSGAVVPHLLQRRALGHVGAVSEETVDDAYV